MTSEGQRRLDSAEVDRLFREYGTRLRQFLVGLLRDGHLAEEALQRTFEQTAKVGGDVSPQSQQPWLFRVAYHEAMAIRRRRQLDARVLQKLALSAEHHGLSPESEVLRTEAADQVRNAVNLLPDEQRRVVVMRTWEQKTFEQISRELQIPLGTVLSRMRLAIEKLRRILNEHE